jgi:hypothetical protein
MNHTKLVVLYCASDAKKGIVKDLITHLRIMVRTIGDTPVKLELTDIELQDFQLDESQVKSYQQERAFIIVLLTPQFLLNDKVVGDGMTALMRITRDVGPRINPIYCLPFPNPESTLWSKLYWFPSNSHDEYKPLTKCGNVDEACSKAANAMRNSLKAMIAKQSTAAEASNETDGQQQPVSDTSRKSEPDHSDEAKSTGARPAAIEESKIPPLAVFVSGSDSKEVESALAPVLTTLMRARNVRSYSPWSIQAGGNWKRQRQLAKHAPFVVIILSASAIADDDIFDIIENIAADQKVLFVLLSSCMWEVLPLEYINYKMLPVNNNKEVVTVHSINQPDQAWQQVSAALLECFPTRLAAETTELTQAEIKMQPNFKAAAQAAQKRAEHRTEPDYDTVRAYWEK